MRLFILVLLLLPCILTNSGCAKITKTYLAKDVFVTTVNKDYVTEDGHIDLSKIDFTKYEGAANKDARNNLISEMIQISDRNCEWHKATVMANANIWNIGSGSANALFSGAASVISHAQTAADFAAAATVTGGVRAIANQEIYRDFLITTILRAIDVQRTKKMAVISTNLANNDYKLQSAIRDVQAYHSSCSLMSGLVEVTNALSERLKSRSELDRDIKRLKQALADAPTTYASSSDDERKDHILKLSEALTRLEVDMLTAPE